MNNKMNIAKENKAGSGFIPKSSDGFSPSRVREDGLSQAEFKVEIKRLRNLMKADIATGTKQLLRRMTILLFAQYIIIMLTIVLANTLL